MFRVLFLLPILLRIAWFWFLRSNQVPLKQGKQGFIYILIFSSFVLGFFTLMIQVTKT